MQLLDFEQYPLWLNLAVLVATAAAVWLTGTQLTRRVEAIAQHTGVGRAFAGLVVLGGVVSLPELSTATGAAVVGNARFAVNTLFGGIAATMVVIAVIDAVVREEPLSTDITHPVVLLQGALSVLFLVVAAAALVVGDVPLLGAGAWTFVLLGLYLLFVELVRHYEWHRAWIPEEDVRRRGAGAAEPEAASHSAGARGPAQAAAHAQSQTAARRPSRAAAHAPSQTAAHGPPQAGPAARSQAGSGAAAPAPERRARDASRGPRPLARLILATVAVALATAAAGVMLSLVGDAVAEQAGLGASFAGLLLGGIATSLPEASTIYAAVRIRRFELVFSDAYGSNLFSTMAIFVADLAYPGGPILNEVGRFGLFAILLGAAVSAIFLAGCLERRNRAVLGMGVDSILVLAVYVGGLVMLYHLR